MKFLWPAAWSLALLALPIILFYLIRQRLRTKSVTTLLFWENLAPKVHNLPLWRRLRRLVSLLLQLLLLALLLFAVARPLLPGQAVAGASTVLVLDPSVTMTTALGQGTRWQAALDLLRQRIDAMSFGDQATLILATDPPQVLSPWTGRKADLRLALAQAKTSSQVTDIRPTLLLARNLVLSHPGATTDLVSDTVWPVAPAPEEEKQLKLDLIGSTVPNSGITLFSARELTSGAGEYQLALKIEQNTAAPVTGELQVLRGGQLMDVLNVTVPVGEPWQKFWRGQSNDAVDFEARWNPQGGDGFPADQQAKTHLDAVRNIAVTLVSPPFPFLEVAFGSQSQVTAQRAWPAPATLPPADLVVFNRTLPPAGPLPRDAVLIDPPGSGPWGDRVGPMDKPLVSDVDRDAPLMRFADLTPVQLHTATEFKPPPGAHVYVSSFGQPLIYGHWEAEPRWLVIGFDLDQSDFVLRTAFPILCANLVEALRQESAASSPNVPGPVATQLKSLASASGGVAAPISSGHLPWARAIPLWWWAACAALLLLLIEWSLYTRRITE
jgi:Ca-activated chloride channel family protein